MPDGFVVLDQNGIVRSANRAFLDLTQTPVEASVIGKRLEPLARGSGVGRDAAGRRAAQPGGAGVPARLEGELGTEVAVEITAVGDRDAGPAHYGVLLRDVSRRQPAEPRSNSAPTPPAAPSAPR